MNVRYADGQAGDVKRTGADTALAGSLLGWKAEVGIREGLQRQAEYIKRHNAQGRVT
ncbi:MAG: hypothetical protein INR62_11755 [Rhodospirillales bacterium]|nr:hypothetical protein [Acetobacter sp.]